MIISSQEIVQLIQEAKDSNADPNDIRELEDHLRHIESDSLSYNAELTFGYERIQSDGTKLLHISTAPIIEGDESDFEGVELKAVKAN